MVPMCQQPPQQLRPLYTAVKYAETNRPAVPKERFYFGMRTTTSITTTTTTTTTTTITTTTTPKALHVFL
ncbi:hypothetical protein M0802_006514 [Mischocyttarus mexicanus]|nr:hypothetical protein M0802_006514 [Mischocyttarus mexicanus]